MRRKAFLLAAFIAVVIFAASCSTAAPKVVSPVPTKTPKPTFTPTPNWTPTPLVILSATPLPATPGPLVSPTPEPPTPVPASATPQGASITAGQNVNVRRGPGTAYPVVGQLTAGQKAVVSAQNADGTWYEFSFNGDAAWVIASLVSVSGDPGSIALAQNIPEPPPPPPTAVPQPTAVPPPAAPPAPPAPPAPTFDWSLASAGSGAPNCGTVAFQGQVQYANGSAQNGVCVYLGYYGPRTIKFSGGGAAGDGNWGFSPCGSQACTGPMEIYIVACPSDMGSHPTGLTLSPGSPAPPPANSAKFTVNVTDRCVTGQWTGIIFKSKN
jgi:hypothetical protein